MNDSYAEAVALVTRQEESRRADEIAHRDAAIAEAVALIAHRAQAAHDSAAMIAAQERSRAEKVRNHSEARAAARVARDRRDQLRLHRQKVQNRWSSSKAELIEAEKQARKLSPPDPDDFPTEGEIDAWRQRRGQLDESFRRIAARVGSEAGELDAARLAEDEAQQELERAAKIEWERRCEI